MIRVFETAEALHRAAAWAWIHAAVDPAPGLIGVATGTTTTPIHEVIASLYATAPFDTKGLALCAVDDYLGIAPGHIASCGERILRQLARPLGLDQGQVLLPAQFMNADDPALAYEAEITRRGGVKMQMLGLGGDGHIGFNYPATPFGSPAHRLSLPQTTKDTLHRLYALPFDAMPAEGLTLGLLSIMRSRRIVVAVTGESKAQAVRAAIEGPVTEAMPASVLQLHRDTLWMLDQSAASALTKSLYP